MLHEQISTYHLPKITEDISRYLVDCLDARGYFEMDPADIAEILRVPHFEVMQALYFLQSLSPIGVGARSLEECLTLQLAQGPEFNEYTMHIVSNGLRLLAQNKISAIAKMLHLSVSKAQYYCDYIRSLNPIPSRGYATQEETAYIIPDAVVECSDEVISLRMNNDFVPCITVNQTYLDLLGEMDAEAQKYIRECMSKADNLLKSIADRNKTLQRIILCVFELQPRFFRDGKCLMPMTMNEVAERLELNVSTVSRAIQGKYIICNGGTVSLRSLFTSGYVANGSDTVSSDTIKEKIRAFVAAEDTKHPLSDAKLCAALKSTGVDVARRTVAKYREELGIPSSQLRKR